MDLTNEPLGKVPKTNEEPFENEPFEKVAENKNSHTSDFNKSKVPKTTMVPKLGNTRETQEELDNARDVENLKRVEAALFISGKFLSTRELVALTDLNPILLNQALQALQEKYDDISAIEVVNKGELWKMDVKNEYMGIVNRLATGSEEFSKTEQETLAVIAHKNPITQSKIVHMRGNKSYDHIKKFLSLGLIKGKKAGRTKELSLSSEFYDYFNVKNKPLEKVSKDENEHSQIEEESDVEVNDQANEGN